MEQTEVNVERQAEKPRAKVWAPIALVLLIAALIVVLLIVGSKILGKNDGKAPVLLAQQSSYSMYEERSDEVLLTYSITLRNDTGEDLTDFALRAELQSDYKSGYILAPEATVRRYADFYRESLDWLLRS